LPPECAFEAQFGRCVVGLVLAEDRNERIEGMLESSPFRNKCEKIPRETLRDARVIQAAVRTESVRTA